MHIIATLDDAARTLGDIRLFGYRGAVREDIARHRDTLNAVRRQLDAARAAP
ncbi:hypothetical protein [Azospirillum sp.]|uniref:hypothetical protein n=1 Tax=Azospirillum sp. TaxID=34012 RepID=UPI003D71A652